MHSLIHRGSSERCNSVDQVGACTHACTQNGDKDACARSGWSQLDTYSSAIHAYAHSYVFSAHLEHFLSLFNVDVVAAWRSVHLRVCICSFRCKKISVCFYISLLHCLEHCSEFYKLLIDSCFSEDRSHLRIQKFDLLKVKYGYAIRISFCC